MAIPGDVAVVELPGDVAVDRRPFEVFPAEIWDSILEKMPTTQDISNVFEACPQLKSLSAGKQFSWMIGKLMPLILPKYLSRRDVLNCRLVSKRFKDAVDIAYETETDRLPYKSPRLIVSERHFCYTTGVFTFATSLRDFINSGMPHVADENPFPGRSVLLTVQPDDGKRDGTLRIVDIIPVLEKFGKHIWYLGISLYTEGNRKDALFMARVIQSLLECLAHLPNLKSLELRHHGGSYFRSTGENVSSSLTLADMPFKLETLEVSKLIDISCDLFQTVMLATVNHEHLQKLIICVDNWNENYGKLFPNLIDLGLRPGVHDDDLSLVSKILADLAEPQKLRKFDVWWDDVNICDVLEIIAPYNLEYLTICGGLWNSPPKPDLEVPSLQELQLFDEPDVSYEFLKCLPKLEYLTINVPGDWSRDETDQDEGAYIAGLTECQLSLRRFALEGRTDYGNIQCFWDAVPTLEMLTFSNCEEASHQYVRECRGKAFATCHTQT